MAHHRRGDFVPAQRILRAIHAQNPTHVPALVLLGDIAQREGRNNAAVKLLSKALALEPRNVAALDAMAMACQALGRDADAQVHFTQAIVLGLGGVEDLIKQNPVVTAALSRLSQAWPRQLPLGELLGPDGIAALADDALLMALLQTRAVCDIALERLLTAIRRGLLHDIDAQQVAADRELAFCCALAQQCFINEYVFALTDAEESQSQAARQHLVDAIKAGTDIPPVRFAITAAYVPLHALAQSGALLERSWPQPAAQLLAMQVREPLEEHADRSAIPALTAIDDPVSLRVRAQYEENPYPRWTGLARPRPSTIDGYLRERLRLPSWPGIGTDAAAILVAGCGTGAHSIETAQRFPQSRVLAVDLSLASLAYARRKTRQTGLSNIDYALADILKLGSLDRRFDVIEAVGVLHHLADPAAGWRILLSLLRPGGVMLVGLYSALARRPVNAVRELIAEHGWRPTAGDIRACRQAMVQRALGPVTADFFTTSRCRDLYFHAVEHQFGIGEIKSFLTANRLTFLGFELPPDIQPLADAIIPANSWTELDRWDAFEQAHPRSFSGMYQFWVQKGADDLVA
jgi:SAM-dependent methyltransferase/tetratricopeptide (TPR) repeat protein